MVSVTKCHSIQGIVDIDKIIIKREKENHHSVTECVLFVWRWVVNSAVSNKQCSTVLTQLSYLFVSGM